MPVDLDYGKIVDYIDYRETTTRKYNARTLVNHGVLTVGFAKIAKSKGCTRKAIKLFVYFICTSGFFYQTWAFLQMYLAYPTMLDISEKIPDSFMGPAFTVCNRNRIFRQPYCKAYPEKCTWNHTTWESFCNMYGRMCPQTKQPDFNFGIPIYKVFGIQDNSNDFLNAVGPQPDSKLIHTCLREGNSPLLPCNSSITVIQVPKNGFPYTCFSLFSLLGNPYKGTPNVTMADGYHIMLHMHPEEYFYTFDPIEASVVLHDPRKKVNPMTDGITFKAGKSYQVFPTMERIESIPPPYASNCMDYLTEWKKNGGSGPLSKDDCMEECKIEAMVSERGCVVPSITYPHGYHICDYYYYDTLSELSRRCASSCRDACEETIYHFTEDFNKDMQLPCKAPYEYCKNRYLIIHVMFSKMRIKITKQIPRIESIELFSYIGGYLGMWLGISLASGFDFAEMVYDVIAYAFLKRKRKKRRENAMLRTF